MNLKILFFIFLSLFMAQNSNAVFIVQNEYCTISNNFIARTSDNTEYNGVINLSFSNQDVLFPIINISLSRNIRPINVSLSWPEARLLDSRGRPIFETSFQSRLSEERNKVFEFTKERSVFYSKAYGFYRFQHFIALFLSQNDVKLNFVNEDNNQAEEHIISLEGSDISFREMTLNCYPNEVVNYINSNFSRKKPVFESWTNGYGMTRFYTFEDLLPIEVRYPNDITEFLNQTSDESYRRLSRIYVLLSEREELNEKINEIALDPNFVTLSQAVDSNASRVLELSQRRDQLGGAEGRINQLELEINALNLNIQNTESLISAYEQDQIPLEERVEILGININQLRSQLSLYDLQISQTQAQNQQYESNLRFLNEVIEKYHEEYQAIELESEIPDPLSIPYSMEEIVNSSALIDAQIEQRSNLNQILSVLVEIQDYIRVLIQNHTETLNLYNELSNLKVRRVQTQISYENNELQRAQINQVIGGISFESILGRINRDRENTSFNNHINRDIKVIFQNEIRNIYNSYDSYIDELRSNDQNIFAKILCKSDSFLRTYRGQCFNPIDMNDNQKIEIYLDQLDSAELSNLFSLFAGRQSLIQRHEIDIVTQISRRIQQEVRLDANQEVLNLWEEILYSRWRYFAVRGLNDSDDFNISNLLDTLRLQEAEIQRIDTMKDELIGLIIELDLQINTLEVSFAIKEAEYFESLNQNQNLILNRLRGSDLDLAALNLNCLLNLTNVDMCSRRFELVSLESNTALDNINTEIRQAVVVLILASRSQIIQLESNLSSSLERLSEYISDRNSFVLATNYNSHNQIFEEARSELQRQQMLLASLYEQKTAAELRLSEMSLERGQARTEFDSLVAEINGLVNSMRPTLNQLTPMCVEQNVFINELFGVETEIHSLLSLNRIPNHFNSICRINF